MAGPPANMTETPNPGRKAGMDALSEVLRVAHLTGGVFLHADFFAPWCITCRARALRTSSPAIDPSDPLSLCRRGRFSHPGRGRGWGGPHNRAGRGRSAAAQRPASYGKRPEPAAGGG